MASGRSGVRSPSAPLFDRLRAGPLGQREFRFLFLGHTTSFVGNAFANVALPFAVLDLTGSKADLGFVLAGPDDPARALSARRRNLGRPPAPPSRDGALERRQRPLPGRDRDALGSWVLIPLGLAVAGPVAELIGTRETILAATAISLTATLAVLFVRDMRTITRRAE